MKKTILMYMMLFCLLATAAQAYYWDTPIYLQQNTKSTTYSDVRVINKGTSYLVFFMSRTRDSAVIQFYRTGDLMDFSGPKTVLENIEVENGFFPHYDVIRWGDALFLVWNTLGGNIYLTESGDGGLTWTRQRSVAESGSYSFDPSLHLSGRNLLLFYHTESEGRRVDFYYSFSADRGKTWSRGQRVPGDFAGSFFPSFLFYKGRYYLAWQSRPLSEQRTPVFDVYLSRMDRLGGVWADPVNLTGSTVGEDERPQLFAREDRLILVWQSDREGVRGIYYQEFDLGGVPLREPVRLTGSVISTREPRLLRVGDSYYVFYIDERTGTGNLSYSIVHAGEFEEGGSLGRIKANVIDHTPLYADGEIYQFWHDTNGVAYTGPDRRTAVPQIKKPFGKYIGRLGHTVHWDSPEDPSGIEGYLYAFNREEKFDPEIVNLSPHMSSLKLRANEEGTWYLHLRTKDGAGNISPTLTVPFSVDLTPPGAPVLSMPEVDGEGYMEGNSPRIEWLSRDRDVIGYNYRLVRDKASARSISSARIRTSKRYRQYQSLQGGEWYFQVAAIDRAGNVSATSYLAFKLRSPIIQREEKPEVRKPLPWMVGGYRFQAHRFLNMALYILLGGLLFITFYITASAVERYRAVREGVAMESEKNIRFGLRFKFSLLIGVLVLLLTLGISTVLSYYTINHEKKALAEQMKRQADLSLENMTNVAREGILNNDELLLLSLIAKTMENRDIEYSAVLDMGNRVIAHSDFEKRGAVLEDEFTLRAAQSAEVLVEPAFSPDKLADLYDLASPVVFADKRIGTVRLGYSTKTISETIGELRRSSRNYIIIITVLTIVVGVIGAIIMATVTIKPIKVLAKGANIIGGGNLKHKIEVKARDEIGMLASEFNRMTDRLFLYQQEMEKKAKLDEQLDIARNIQQSMIPGSGIENEKLSIDGYYQAAAGVGGDYYDFVEVENGVYGLIMSDVAGKGVPASLMMIMIRTIFKSLINSGVQDPGRIVTLMNSILAADISSDRFATLLFGTFNLKNGVFRYTNAGYGPIMIYKGSKGRCFQVNPPSSSIPIGVMPDVEYAEEKPIRLQSGDSLYLFTDGVLEARSTSEEEYGMTRLSSFIPGVAERDSKDIANAIVDNVLSFVGNAEQFDDMTLMVMKLK